MLRNLAALVKAMAPELALAAIGAGITMLIRWQEQTGAEIAATRGELGRLRDERASLACEIEDQRQGLAALERANRATADPDAVATPEPG